MDRVETSMSEVSISFNTMVDAHKAHSEDIMWLKNKVPGLENRYRRNNIKIKEGARFNPAGPIDAICSYPLFFPGSL